MHFRSFLLSIINAFRGKIIDEDDDDDVDDDVVEDGDISGGRFTHCSF